MKQADLIGWNWELIDGRLVMLPTGAAHARYLLLLFFGPLLTLFLLVGTGLTPWGLEVARQRNALPPPLTAEQQAELNRLHQSMLDNLKNKLGEESFENVERNLAAPQAQRAEEAQERRRRDARVGWLITVLIGAFWTLIVFFGVILIFALIRLCSAKYTFEKTPTGELVVLIPKLLGNTRYQVPLAAIRDVEIACRKQLVGRYGIPVLLWGIAFVLRSECRSVLPIFVVDEELARSASGRPSDRAEDLQRQLKKFLGDHEPI